MTKVDELMQGSYDLHIHSGPGMVKRSVTHVEACKMAYAAGQRAIVLKDQHFTTQNLPPVLEECLQFERPFNVYGGLVLCNTSGGFSPAVVEGAIKQGIKCVWMPTLAAHFNRVYKSGLTGAALASMPKSTSALQYDYDMTLTDDNGKLKQEIVDILKLCVDADIYIGNGHISQAETDAMIDKAIGLGSKKVVINHPELHLKMPLEKQVEYTKAGVWLEHILAIVYSNKSSHEYIYEMIQATGTDHVIVSSDLGQVGRPVPVDGMRNFMQAMLDLGMPEADIRKVTRDNPAFLVGHTA